MLKTLAVAAEMGAACRGVLSVNYDVSLHAGTWGPCRA